MNCVSYTRLTSCTDKSFSIEEQNAIIGSFADSNKLKIVKRYSDRKNDPKADAAFQQLSNDGIARKYDCVVFCSMFMFGPSTYVGYDLLSKTFAPCGVHFVVIEDGFVSWEHTAEEIETYLKERYKDYSTYIHRLDVWKANKNRSLDKYGYITLPNNSGYELDEPAAIIVKEIFMRTLNGEMPTPITRDLIQRHISSPMQRFAELKNDDPSNEKGWTVQWVKNILKTVHYTGRYTRNFEGTIENFECPVIINQPDYDAVQSIFIERKRKESPRERFTNPFVGKLYDYTTGLPLTVVINRHRNWYEYHPRSSDLKLMQYENKKWVFDNVYRQAIDVLNIEREKAERALAFIRSDEGQFTIAEIIGNVINRRQVLFDKMLELADNILPNTHTENGTEEFNTLDKAFNAATEEIKNLELIYSENNPWIKKFVIDTPSDKIEMKNLGSFFSKVWSHKFESLEFLVSDSEWRDMLPEEWR